MALCLRMGCHIRIVIIKSIAKMPICEKLNGIMGIWSSIEVALEVKVGGVGLRFGNGGKVTV